MQPQGRWVQLPPRDPPPPPPAPPAPGYIEEGRYLLEILAVEEKISLHDVQYLNLQCKVQHPAIHDDFRVYLVLSLTEKALWRMREFLEALWNVPVDGMVFVVPENWVSMRFYADLEVIEYRGRSQGNRVGRLYPAYPVAGRDY